MYFKIAVLMFGFAISLPQYGLTQERAAGGPVDTQVTWTTLSNLAKAASDKADAVNSRVDQVVVCGKKGMLYAPLPNPGSDAQGCYEAKTIGGTALTTVNNNVSSVIACNKLGLIFNGTSCITPAGKATATVSQVRAVGSSIANATCPAGTLLVGCAGSRSPTFSDTCDERDCGMIGAGPVSSNTCRTSIDTDKGTQSTAWAFCLKVD